MEVADEDGGRAVGRDAALASPAVLARRGVAAVAAGIGLENIKDVMYAYIQGRAKSSYKKHMIWFESSLDLSGLDPLWPATYAQQSSFG